MKILKVFGLVVGIHVFALILIFANPGCSSTTKPTPADTRAKDATADATPSVSVPMSASSTATQSTPPPVDLSASTPIVAAPLDYSASAGVRFTPMRPGSSAAAAVQGPTQVEDVTPVTTYTVVKGDSLWSVAKKNHLTVAQLAAANRLKAGTPVHIGQKLIIPTTGVATTAPTQVAAAQSAPAMAESKATRASPVKHVVKPGETLGGIAHQYGVNYGEIALVNNISDPTKIRPGMELIIPAPKKTPKATATATALAPATMPGASPAPQNGTPIIPTPDQSKPFFTPPPADRDLDSGIKAGTADAPVIQIEDPNHK